MNERENGTHSVTRHAAMLPEAECQIQSPGRASAPGGLTAVQWLLNQRTAGKRSKVQIDATLEAERDW